MKVLIDTNIVIDALTSPITDYEDAVVEQVAGRYGMECIVTRMES